MGFYYFFINILIFSQRNNVIYIEGIATATSICHLPHITNVFDIITTICHLLHATKVIATAITIYSNEFFWSFFLLEKQIHLLSIWKNKIKYIGNMSRR